MNVDQLRLLDRFRDDAVTAYLGARVGDPDADERMDALDDVAEWLQRDHGIPRRRLVLAACSALHRVRSMDSDDAIEWCAAHGGLPYIRN
jgi:hypothetical protein